MEIPTKVVRYFLGMTVLFEAHAHLYKFQFIVLPAKNGYSVFRRIPAISFAPAAGGFLFNGHPPNRFTQNLKPGLLVLQYLIRISVLPAKRQIGI